MRETKLGWGGIALVGIASSVAVGVFLYTHLETKKFEYVVHTDRLESDPICWHGQIPRGDTPLYLTLYKVAGFAVKGDVIRVDHLMLDLPLLGSVSSQTEFEVQRDPIGVVFKSPSTLKLQRLLLGISLVPFFVSLMLVIMITIVRHTSDRKIGSSIPI